MKVKIFRATGEPAIEALEGTINLWLESGLPSAMAVKHTGAAVSEMGSDTRLVVTVWYDRS